jgi:predicted nucleic acid-binding protein
MSDGGAVLVDTGPLVALFDPSDAANGTCRAALAQLERRRLVTTLAALTEATHLLSFSFKAQEALLAYVSAGAIEMADFVASDVSKAASHMLKYSDLPMDFADATLVVVAERLGTMDVFTLDGAFAIYRLARKRFRILPAR